MGNHNKIILSIFVLLPLFTGGLAVGGLQSAYATVLGCGDTICALDEDRQSCPADCGDAECVMDDECDTNNFCDQDVFIQFECVDFICEEDRAEDCSDDGNMCNGITACDDSLGCVEFEPSVQCDDVLQCGTVQCNPSSGMCDNFNGNDDDCDGGGSAFCDLDVLRVLECQEGICEEDKEPKACSEEGDQCNVGFCAIDGCVIDPVPFEGLECDEGDGLCTSGECVPVNAVDAACNDITEGMFPNGIGVVGLDTVLLKCFDAEDPCFADGVPVKDGDLTECSFAVIGANSFGETFIINDSIPAEWKIVELEEISSCDYDQANKGKKESKSATLVECVAEPGKYGGFNATVETRESPGKGHKEGIVYKPTSCGTFELNNGAVMLLGDENGEPVLEEVEDGVFEPIVLAETGPLTLNAVDPDDLDCDGVPNAEDACSNSDPINFGPIDGWGCDTNQTDN